MQHRRSIFDTQPGDIAAKQALLRSSSAMLAPRFAPQRPQTAPDQQQQQNDDQRQHVFLSTVNTGPSSSSSLSPTAPPARVASSPMLHAAMGNTTGGGGGSSSLAAPMIGVTSPTGDIGLGKGIVRRGSNTDSDIGTPGKDHHHHHHHHHHHDGRSEPTTPDGPSLRNPMDRRASGGGGSGPTTPLLSMRAGGSGGGTPLFQTTPPTTPPPHMTVTVTGSSPQTTTLQIPGGGSGGATADNNNNNGIAPPIFFVSSSDSPPASGATTRRHHQQQQQKPADPLDEDPIFRLWMRRNPDADNTQIAGAKYRRMREIADAQRTERVHFLRQLQGDLQHLRSVDELGERAATKLDGLISHHHHHSPAMQAAGASGSSSPASTSVAAAAELEKHQQHAASTSSYVSPSAKRSVQDAMREAEVEAQRLAWMTYTGELEEEQQKTAARLQQISRKETPSRSKGKDGATKQGISSSSSSSSPSKTAAGSIGELARRGWSDSAGVWHSSTDRHENAATSIQCAFRCFVARVRANNKRRLRSRALHKVIEAEAALERAWVAATSVRDKTQSLASEVDKTIRVMATFTERFKAVLARRRHRKARAQELSDETTEYAAVKMQAAVRGFLVRRRIAMIRDPSLAAAKQALIEDKAVTQIQRAMRGRLARVFVDRRKKAATKIQAVYRRHLCLYRAGQVRRAKLVAADAEIADYAARVIQSFMRSLVVRRRRGLREYRSQALLVQKAGRGYLNRLLAARVFNGMIDEAATDIQRMFRGWYARSNFVSGLVTAHKKAMEEALQQHAACIVTRAFRRAKIFADKRNELLRGVAATEIQRMFRGHVARTVFKAAKQSEEDELKLQQQENAATVIQAAWRGVAVRKQNPVVLRGLGAARGGQDADAASSRRSERSSRPTSATSTRDQQQQEAAAAAFAHIDPTNEKMQLAASTMQRFYRRNIRHPKMRRLVFASALRVQHFLLTLRPRKNLFLNRRFHALGVTDDSRASNEQETAAAVLDLTHFLQRRVAARKEYRSDRFVAHRRGAVVRAEEAEQQEEEKAAITLQRCVRGYLVRRYLLVVSGVHRSEEAREAAAAELSRPPPEGVSSYEAATALQKYFVKNAPADAATPQPSPEKAEREPTRPVEEDEEL